MKRYLPSILFLTLLTLFMLPLHTLSAEAPTEIVLPAKIGTVTFGHTVHQQRVDSCTTCHHQGEPVPCGNCHGVKTEAPLAKDAFHRQCRSCHQKQAGPTDCKECHQ